jgi:hypothetical protein
LRRVTLAAAIITAAGLSCALVFIYFAAFPGRSSR